MIRLQCEYCQEKLSIKSGHAGKTVRCPACKKSIQVPPESPETVGSNSKFVDVPSRKTGDHPVESLETELVSAEWPDLQEFVQAETLSDQLPPARPRKESKERRVIQPVAKRETLKTSTNTKSCIGCGKSLDISDRFCVACGCSDFDAAGAVVLAEQKLKNQVEGQYQKLFFFRWLRFLSRLLR